MEHVVDKAEFFFSSPETLYHFGDNDREGWAELFSLYQLPPYELPGLQPVLSFGLAGSEHCHSKTASCCQIILPSNIKLEKEMKLTTQV